MTKPALFTLTLLLLAPLAHAAPPDRCSTLDEYGYPSQCEPIGWRLAPYWNDEVCCNDDVCVESTTHGCADDMRPYFCKYAEADALGRIACMFLVPDYCDENPCSPSPAYQSQPLAEVVCCHDDGPCYFYDHTTDGGCPGNIFFCKHGTCNEDGTITCDTTPQ
jgi:hypothetical protein